MAAQCLGRTGRNELNAAQEGKVHFYCTGLTFTIENFAALQLMASLFYPDRFGDLDPIAGLEGSCELCMPIGPEGTRYCSTAEAE